nr:MAG TPA: hypothetical protein [Caudoviricetes sp.]
MNFYMFPYSRDYIFTTISAFHTSVSLDTYSTSASQHFR